MSFSKILGQEAALERLKRLAKDKRLPPALLFHGPSGVGKTSAALELAKALNCARLEEGDPCGACEIGRAHV